MVTVMRNEYVVNGNVICVTGPMASYYASTCTDCGVHTPYLYQWKTTTKNYVRLDLLCRSCYQVAAK